MKLIERIKKFFGFGPVCVGSNPGRVLRIWVNGEPVPNDHPVPENILKNISEDDESGTWKFTVIGGPWLVDEYHNHKLDPFKCYSKQGLKDLLTRSIEEGCYQEYIDSILDELNRRK